MRAETAAMRGCGRMFSRAFRAGTGCAHSYTKQSWRNHESQEPTPFLRTVRGRWPSGGECLRERSARFGRSNLPGSGAGIRSGAPDGASDAASTTTAVRDDVGLRQGVSLRLGGVRLPSGGPGWGEGLRPDVREGRGLPRSAARGCAPMPARRLRSGPAPAPSPQGVRQRRCLPGRLSPWVQGLRLPCNAPWGEGLCPHLRHGLRLPARRRHPASVLQGKLLRSVGPSASLKETPGAPNMLTT